MHAARIQTGRILAARAGHDGKAAQLNSLQPKCKRAPDRSPARGVGAYAAGMGEVLGRSAGIFPRVAEIASGGQSSVSIDANGAAAVEEDGIRAGGTGVAVEHR